jgi:hypothetical protein
MFVKGEDLLFQITFCVSEHETKSVLTYVLANSTYVLANSTYAFQYFYCSYQLE